MTGPLTASASIEHLAALFRVLDGETCPTAGPGEGGEVDRLQVAGELRIAQKDHLFPLDLAQRVVLDDDDLDRELVLDRGHELGHEHGEAAVADEADARPVGVGHLRGDGVRQTARHRGQRPRNRVQLPAFDRNVPGPPGGDGARIARDDGVVRQAAGPARAPPPAASSACRCGWRARASASSTPSFPSALSPGSCDPSFFCSSGSSACRVRRLSPTRPTSTG